MDGDETHAAVTVTDSPRSRGDDPTVAARHKCRGV